MADSKSTTVVPIIGLILSLVGNYVQYKKNTNDAQIAQQQIDIARQQVTTAQEELSIKQKELELSQRTQSREEKNCDQKHAEHDDALNAVHMYDESITQHQVSLQLEKGQLAMARAAHDSFKTAEHSSLAESEESTIKSLTDSRDKAAARVRDIEQQCHY